MREHEHNVLCVSLKIVNIRDEEGFVGDGVSPVVRS